MKKRAKEPASQESSRSKKKSAPLFAKTRLGKAAARLEKQLDEHNIDGSQHTYPIQDDTIIASPLADGVFFTWYLTSGGIARARTQLTSLEPATLQLKIYLDRGLGTADVISLPINRWSDSLRYPVPQGARRVSATLGLLAGEDFIHITGSAPIPLMKRNPGAAPISISTVERGKKGLMIKETTEWVGESQEPNWHSMVLAISTLSIMPRSSELDKGRIERRSSGGGR